MENPSPFIIYNASAGSGKTFVLVKSFLSKILLSKQKDYFKYLLAITFTNKAVAEMKQRVIDTLISFALNENSNNNNELLNIIQAETDLSKEEIKSRSQQVLKYLLNHYSLFSIETIDHFNLRLLRTFARDLKLPANFEVSLETPQLILKAIDKLLGRAGSDKEITQLLVDFALQKTDEDKSWDVTQDLNKAAKLLTSENDLPYLEKLSDKSISDFKNLEKQILESLHAEKSKTATEASRLLEMFSKEGLERGHFSGGYSYDFFVKISEENFQVKFDLSWQKNLGIKPLNKAKEDPIIVQKIDALTPDVISTFNNIKTSFYTISLYENILKNLVPLATVNLVNQELETIKKEEGILPISEFNKIISNEIKNEPAPYIYERLGERYRHFFIDEFQDTSQLQWQNLIPLIDNALAQNYNTNNSGSLLLVGDAKQSIYRWRGGLPEQFIDLCYSQNPFPSVNKEVKNLETNYRSCKQIVDFNNQFFSFISAYFGESSYSKIYEEGNKQLSNNDCKGFVSINFIEPATKKEVSTTYSQKVLETIQDLEKRGCPKNEICVLTRKKDEGIAVSEFLIANNISVISEETLLLQNSKIVQFLINFLQLTLFPKQEDLKIKVLEFLYEHLEIETGQHKFFSEYIKAPISKLEDILHKHQLNLSFNYIYSLSLYESFEYLIQEMKLKKQANAYVLHFMDLVFQNASYNKQEFLSYWDSEKDKISLSKSSEEDDAINIMTIHKSKGLEFPVVIFPFADLNIYKEIEPKTWFPFQNNGFDDLLLNYNKQVENYGEIGANISQARRNTLEFDNINLLYVALTRSKKELFVFAQNTKISTSPKRYNDFFRLFLEKENENKFDFGEKTQWVKKTLVTSKNNLTTTYSVGSAFKNNLKIVSKERKDLTGEYNKSLAFGNTIHEVLATIKTEDDLEFTLTNLSANALNKEEVVVIVNTLKNVVFHPDLNKLFSKENTIYNEQDIISSSGVIRPDRVNVYPNNSITVLDYKTGSPNISHEHQVNTYAQVLEEMGYSIKDKIIVYIKNTGISIKNL